MTFSNGRVARVSQWKSIVGKAGLACVILFIGLMPGLAICQDDINSEHLLPEDTKAWVSVPDIDLLRQALEKTQFGLMTKDPNVKPFVDDLVRQFRGFLDQQNIQFGIKLADIEKVKSGEVCLAGILRPPVAGADEAPPDHAIVLMVDVLDSQAEAQELLTRVAGEMEERGATSESIKIGEVEATKWTLDKPVGLRARQFAFHGIIGRWLLACDNESVFRDIVTEVTGNANAPTHLADNPVFQEIEKQTQPGAGNGPAHIRWFVEPIGYMNLAQSIADAKNGGKTLRNDHVRILSEEGFSAIKGAGGSASFATGKHEVIHKTFVYAPHNEDAPLTRGAQILDFRNTNGDNLSPPSWVPAESASYLTFTWKLRNALENIGYVLDSMAGAPGSWLRTLDGYKNDPNGFKVDLRRVADSLEDRLTVISVTAEPISEDSERIVFGIRILHDVQFVTDSVHRIVKNKAVVVPHMGVDIMVIDTSEEIGGGGFEIEGDPLDLDSEFSMEDDDDGFRKAKPFFEKRVVAVKDGILLIGNNVDQMKSLVSAMGDEPGLLLEAADDYQRIEAALVELAGDEAPSFRHFGRMDLSIRPNYEMMRAGRMGQSKTLLGQLINRAYEDENTDPDAIRAQEIDGTNMPEDFDGKVAKYFGPTGLVVHTNNNGWLVTGCVLTREQSTSATTVVEESAPVDEAKEPKVDTLTDKLTDK